VRRAGLRAVVAGLLVCAGLSEGARPARALDAADVSREIRRLLDSGRGLVTGVVAPAERTTIVSLYGPRAAPLWTDPAGRPTADARDALALFDGAAADGLDPAAYHAGALDSRAAALAAGRAGAAEVAAFDVGLSAGVLRYLRHLHHGRVDPRALGLRMTTPRDEHDGAAIVREALAGHRLNAAAAGLAPPLAQYRSLRLMLARYRALASDPTLTPPAASRTVHPGQPYPDLLSLQRLLVALGDLPSGLPPAGTIYDGAIADGVKRFQVRHGLEPDAVLGRATQAALRVPLAWRARQIEMALERLRWLPHLGTERLIALNVPMFRLWAWSANPPDGAPSFGMNAIVGRARGFQTPVFVEEMRTIIFRPYWNVPASILRAEILPALALDPGFLRKENMEIVAGPGDDAPVLAPTAEHIAELAAGRVRVRQRPGPKNALGLVKFDFPNADAVYMHATPAAALFRRARRDFSHGCVRVEHPIELAEWVLDAPEVWPRERILAAMNATETRTVMLARPVQVILFYTTAAVMPEDGTIHFADDIYRRDAALDRALATAAPAR